MINLMIWYADRYHTERRDLRRRMRGINRPWTGRALLVVLCLLAAIALWVIAPPALADAMYTVTVDDWCNIRAEPRKDSADAGNLYPGDTVTGTAYQSGWVLLTNELLADGTQIALSVEPGKGWVREDMLTLADYPTGQYANSTGGRVNIRKEPDGDHAAWLKAGHNVDVLRWVDVDGTAWAVTRKGYIDGSCLEVAIQRGE